MSNLEVAEDIFNELVEKGAGIGNASIRIIERVLDNTYPQTVESILSIEDVIAKIRRGDYTASHEPRQGYVDRRALLAERSRLRKVFQTDALNTTGLAGHPKAEGIFDFAWNQSHGSGLEEVLNTLENLSEVLL